MSVTPICKILHCTSEALNIKEIIMENCATKDFSKHPCFNAGAKGKYGRVHLPVAPKCNIKCNFCDRKYDCVNESRPGVTSRINHPGTGGYLCRQGGGKGAPYNRSRNCRAWRPVRQRIRNHGNHQTVEQAPSGHDAVSLFEWHGHRSLY